MVYTPEFMFGILPAVLCLLALLRRVRPDMIPLCLLLVSIAVFGAFHPYQSIVVLVMVAFNVMALGAIYRGVGPTGWVVAGAAVVHVGVLIAYKYYLTDQLPFGLSFVTFLNLSALLDARSRPALAQNPVQNALYAAQFATIAHGPITRFKDLQPQIAALKTKQVDAETLITGLGLFVFGLAKAQLIGYPLHVIADDIATAAGNGATVLFLEVWIGAWAALLSVYFQFSGYSDMAIACGMMVGLNLAPNFNSPLMAKSPSEFWNRWHMSLTTWIRVYLFMPVFKQIIGWFQRGSRRGEITAWATATMVSMTIFGAWHGNAMAFVYWGAFAGFCLVVSQMPGALGRSWQRHIGPRISQTLLFLVLAPPTYVFFAHDLATLGMLMSAMADPTTLSLPGRMAVFMPLGLLGTFVFDGLLPNVSGRTLDAFLYVLGGTLAALIAPNSMQIFGLLPRQKPAGLTWRLSPGWGLAVGVLLALCIPTILSGVDTGFIYDGF